MSEQEEHAKEDYAKQFMTEEGLKGKSKRIEVMRIIDQVGFDKRRIKTALARSTIMERIHNE